MLIIEDDGILQVHNSSKSASPPWSRKRKKRRASGHFSAKYLIFCLKVIRKVISAQYCAKESLSVKYSANQNILPMRHIIR